MEQSGNGINGHGPQQPGEIAAEKQPEQEVMIAEVPLETPTMLPRTLETAAPEVLLYNRNAQGMVVAVPKQLQHRQMEQVLAVQHLNLFHPDERGQFEPYIRVINQIRSRYIQMNNQISVLSKFLAGLLGSNPRFLAMPVTLLQFVEYGYVNSLANKFKVLYSKGRKFMSERHEFDGVHNAMEKCLDLVRKGTTSEKKKQEQRALSRRVLQAIASQFHIITHRTACYIKYHALPENFNYEKFEGKPFRFYVSFYVEELLMERNEQPTPFPSQLLYCPIMWDPAQQRYLIASNYLELVEQRYYNWQNLMLCVDVCCSRGFEDEVIYVSYLDRNFAADKLLGMLSLLRDKIYQFQMFEFLKVLFDQSGSIIKIPLSKTHSARIYLAQRQEVVDFKYVTELLTVLFVNLRPERKAQLDRSTLRKKLRSRFEEVLIVRYSADKLAEELHVLRRDDELPLQFRKIDKTKMEACDFYKSIEGQRT